MGFNTIEWQACVIVVYYNYAGQARGKTSMIANQLLEREEVVYVGKSIGEHTIDLRSEIIIKDSAELLNVLEVKYLEGVKDTV